MSATKYILTETAIFSPKLIHHEERAKSYPENLPNLTNPLASNIEAGNDKFIFKEANNKPEGLDFVGATRKKIGAHEIDKYWNLVRRRELNRKNTIITIWSFNRNKALYGRLIKHKPRLCAHGGMH